jgi:phospholipid/cholesterol/gamma-HCH transport system ATP-binding protein
MPEVKEPHIVVKDITLAYGSNVVQQQCQFHRQPRGCVHHHGRQWLRQEHDHAGPHRAQAAIDRRDSLQWCRILSARPRTRIRFAASFGVMFQSGALWSSMTLAENVSLPIRTVHQPETRPDQQDRLPEAVAGRPGRLRGLLSLPDQRWHV